MPAFTFTLPAAVTIDAETEEEARDRLRKTLYEEEDFVFYGEAEVYIPSYNVADAELTEVA